MRHRLSLGLLLMWCGGCALEPTAKDSRATLAGPAAPGETAPSGQPFRDTGGRIAPRVAAAKLEPVPAPVVQWTSADGGNGHYYQAVFAPSGITWDDAQVWAVAHGGYLATIGTAAENNFVFRLVDDLRFWRVVPTTNTTNCFVGPWLGGLRPPDAPELSKGWRWVNDDGPFAYTAWASKQPDNDNGHEERLQFFSWNPGSPRATWNDQPGDTAERGFVLEYVNATLAPVGEEKVPTPPTLLPPEIELSRVVQWTATGGNGHYYQAVVVPNGIKWSVAQAWATAHGGWLATIGSAAENDFVFQLIDAARFWTNDKDGGSHGPWLGGIQPPGSKEPDGGWQWINNEGPFTYAHWASGQPNDRDSDDRVQYYSAQRDGRANTWADVPGEKEFQRSRAFVVEYVSAALAPNDVGPSARITPESLLQPEAVVQWAFADGGNGHYYQAIAAPGGIKWDDAQAMAVAHGGYLATIGSAAENDFVFHLVDNPRFWSTNQMGSSIGPLIGGFKTPGSKAADKGWQWVNGEGAFTYTHWAPNQPDNTNGNEDRLQFFVKGVKGARQNTWNDQLASTDEYGFVVEYATRPAL